MQHCCLASEHFVRDCRDPVRCCACGASGHRQSSCMMPIPRVQTPLHHRSPTPRRSVNPVPFPVDGVALPSQKLPPPALPLSPVLPLPPCRIVLPRLGAGPSAHADGGSPSGAQRDRPLALSSGQPLDPAPHLLCWSSRPPSRFSPMGYGQCHPAPRALLHPLPQPPRSPSLAHFGAAPAVSVAALLDASASASLTLLLPRRQRPGAPSRRRQHLAAKAPAEFVHATP